MTHRNRLAALTSFVVLLALCALPALGAGNWVLQPVAEPAEPAAALDAGRVEAGVDRPRDLLFLPWYKIDRRSAAGESTLLTIRNTTRFGSHADLAFFTAGDELLLERRIELDPQQVFSMNLRDVPELEAGPDGFARGWIHIDSFWPVSADYLQVDPAQNFATGGRLPDDTCDVWDLRYLSGGAFSGGTRIQVFANQPLGSNPSTDTPTAVIVVLSEPGDVVGQINLFMAHRVVEITAAAILDLLPASAPPFGALVFDFADGADNGFVQGTFSASGKFSAGMGGTCLEFD